MVRRYCNIRTLPIRFHYRYRLDRLWTMERLRQLRNPMGANAVGPDVDYQEDGDSDRDGISNARETEALGTNPYRADSDADGLTDAEEEAYWGEDFDKDFDQDGIANIVDRDSDADGFIDGREVHGDSDPGDRTSVPPGIRITIDSDRDGFVDVFEIDYLGTNPYCADSDFDGLNDWEERLIWLNESDYDTDGDGVPNVWDLDSDNDGFSDGLEVQENSDPGQPSSVP